MRDLNKVTLIGNLGKDPEPQTLEGGADVAKFPPATTESFKDAEGTTHSQAEWHTVVLWRGLADLTAKYLRKGGPAYLEEKVRTRAFEDKTGVKKQVTEITAESLIMPGNPDDLTQSGNNRTRLRIWLRNKE